MPDFENDDLALLGRKLGQLVHCRPFARRLGFAPLEPSGGLQFTGNSPPEAATVVERPIPVGPDAIMLRLIRDGLTLHEGHKGLLEDILGLAMGQPKRPAI